MPITKSAKKAQRQTISREARNKTVKRDLKDAVRAFEKAVKSGGKDEAAKLLSSAYKKLDKAAKKGVIKPGTSARNKSRLFRKLKAASAK